MNPTKSLNASLWAMIVLQTIGSVDMPGRGARKMPAPRNYVAIIVTWAILGLVGETRASRIASAMAWVLVLVGAMLGPFGQRAVGLLDAIARNYGAPPPAQAPFGTYQSPSGEMPA